MRSIQSHLPIVTLLLLCACKPALFGGLASGGVAAAQERSVGEAVDDAGIYAEMQHEFIQKDINKLLLNVNVNVHEGRVLLTGDVEEEKTAMDAVRLAWGVKGVREIINEIQVLPDPGFMPAANDHWINAQLDTKLLVTKGIKSINYSTRVVNGVVYLLGIAQSQEELDRALRVASTIKGVKQVISHVRLKDDPSRLQ